MWNLIWKNYFTLFHIGFFLFENVNKIWNNVLLNFYWIQQGIRSIYLNLLSRRLLKICFLRPQKCAGFLHVFIRWGCSLIWEQWWMAAAKKGWWWTFPFLFSLTLSAIQRRHATKTSTNQGRKVPIVHKHFQSAANNKQAEPPGSDDRIQLWMGLDWTNTNNLVRRVPFGYCCTALGFMWRNNGKNSVGKIGVVGRLLFRLPLFGIVFFLNLKLGKTRFILICIWICFLYQSN